MDSCYICNGYYGPCFGEPVCATCHAFIFPDFASGDGEIDGFTAKSDDGDSGNDEPADLYFQVERSRPTPFFKYLHEDIPPTPPDSLSKRINMLSEHADEQECSIIVERMPPEVLLLVFSYLDELSLWSVGNVCKRWRFVVNYNISSERWCSFTLRRWPLFHPFFKIDDWFTMYSKLMKSCWCQTCIRQMACQELPPPREENSWRRNRLRNELKIMRSDPPEGIEAIPLDAMGCHWQATITGPVGSPYEGGLFYIYLQVPYSYPMSPPVVRFLTKILHPNISRHGDVGIDSIHHNWSLALTISKLLISIQSLLTDPFCDVCMEPEIGSLYLRNRQMFEDEARAWTWKYAMLDLLPCPAEPDMEPTHGQAAE